MINCLRDWADFDRYHESRWFKVKHFVQTLVYEDDGVGLALSQPEEKHPRVIFQMVGCIAWFLFSSNHARKTVRSQLHHHTEQHF